MFSKQLRLFVMLMVSLWWTLPASSGKKACSCYTFHGDLRRWYLSRQHCLDNGGDLVSLETIEEWSRINDEIQHRTTHRLGYNEWHIGLTNLTGVWRWMNNKTLTYDRWQENEPEYVTYKPFVTMAKNWPIGMKGLFNSLREDLSRGRICEYKRSCVSINETCRKLAARFTATTPKPLRLFTGLVPTHTTKQPTEHKTNPVFKGENPTSKPNSKIQEKTPLYIVVVIIILGALIFGCCCIVIVAFRWKKKRKAEKKSKDEDQAGNEAAVKTHDSSESSSESDEFDDDSQQEAGKTVLANSQNGPKVVINDTNSRHDYRTSPLKHEYAEIMIVEEDNNCSGGGNDCNGRERIKEHRVRFACDENERLGNECISNGKRNHPRKEDYNSNGNYFVEHCKKHHGSKKNRNLETTSPRVKINYRKQMMLKINDDDSGTMEEDDEEGEEEIEEEEESHDMEIVKLDVAMPTKEAQYASIVEIYPHEHESIINRNKKPFLKTFAPVNGYHHHQNGRNFEEYEQNGTKYEQNDRDFELYEQNGNIFHQYEQNGRHCDERDLTTYMSGDKSVNNSSHTRPHEALYAVVNNSKSVNNSSHTRPHEAVYAVVDKSKSVNNSSHTRPHEAVYAVVDKSKSVNNSSHTRPHEAVYAVVDKSKSVNNSSHTRPHEAVYAVVDKSKKTNKKVVYPNVRMNYVELADFDKNAVLYTKMPPHYPATRYTEVEIPNEWD